MRKNQHVISLYDDSEVSEFSDSIEDFEGDEQRFLKLRQKSRKKKKSSSFSKKQLGKSPNVLVQGSSKSGNAEKCSYQVCSTHRRATSHRIGRKDGWSDGSVGRQAHTLDFGASQHSSIHFF